MDDLKPIFDLALAYDPYMGLKSFKDVHTPRLWVNSGCDVRLDCVPAMNDAMKRNGHIRTFSYFTQAVEQSRDRRKARELAESPTPAVRGVSEALKAKNIAIATRKYGRCMPAESRWLQNYEKQHGEVAY